MHCHARMDTLDPNQARGFDALLRPHLERLYRFAYRLTEAPSEADDLFQDVLVKAYERLEQLLDLDDPASWLCRVMYNHFIDNRRRYARRSLVSVDEAHIGSIDMAPGGEDPATNAERADNIIRLDQALAQLSPEHRLVLMMHDAEGYKLKEIQDITGDPIGTVKSRLHRARARMREIIAADATFSKPPACKGATEDEIDDLQTA